jgi:hypothetical protein
LVGSSSPFLEELDWPLYLLTSSMNLRIGLNLSRKQSKIIRLKGLETITSYKSPTF